MSSSFAPWDKSEAENEAFNRMVYGKRLSPHQQEIWLDALAWAAAQIEKCETVDSAAGRIWTLKSGSENYIYQAKLVGVREVKK